MAERLHIGRGPKNLSHFFTFLVIIHYELKSYRCVLRILTKKVQKIFASHQGGNFYK